jgi:hypothetical protein
MPKEVRSSLAAIAEREPVVSDPILIPLIGASDDECRQQELEVLLVEHARPTIESVIGRFAKGDSLVGRDATEEIASTVTLRLIRKLQSMSDVEDEVIRDFESYVATLTYRTIYDFMRERFPERTRLKNRIRYLLTHDARFAIWMSKEGTVCGLASWKRSTDVLTAFTVAPGMATAGMTDRDRPDRAVLAILQRAGRPIELNALVTITSTLWNVSEVQHEDDALLRDPHPSHAVQLETRQMLELLWNEIRDLSSNQRTALLLNLRDPSGMNAVALFLLLGVARFEEIAESTGMSVDDLAAVWEHLPLDDLAIAARLNITRQQVINLRRAARERLARRTLLGKYERRS